MLVRISATPYPYHGEGDDVVAGGFPKWEPSPLKGRGSLGRVHINRDQYFADVLEVAEVLIDRAIQFVLGAGHRGRATGRAEQSHAS